MSKAYTGTCSTASHSSWVGVVLPITAQIEIMAVAAAKVASMMSGMSSSMRPLECSCEKICERGWCGYVAPILKSIP